MSTAEWWEQKGFQFLSRWVCRLCVGDSWSLHFRTKQSLFHKQAHKEFGEDEEFQNKMSHVSLLILNLIVDVQRNKFCRLWDSSFLVSILILLCRLIFWYNLFYHVKGRINTRVEMYRWIEKPTFDFPPVGWKLQLGGEVWLCLVGILIL